jgi:hypothetical protein
MHRLGSGGEALRACRSAGVARPVFGEARENGTGAADMLVGDERYRPLPTISLTGW